MVKRILIPLPRKDFDPTEVAIPWRILSSNNIQIVFATPDGLKPACDQRMLMGKDLGILAPLLQADKNTQSAYREMSDSKEFSNPMKWSDLEGQNFDGLLLPGGHDKGMIEYLESDILQKIVSLYFESEKPVGAICHGVVLVARSKAKDGKSILFGRKTTSLLASQELLAWGLTCLWLKDYYRTYPVTVEAEVRSCLASNNDFLAGPTPLLRDSVGKLKRGFVVQDKNYISSRWPGDAHTFGFKFLELVSESTGLKEK